MTKCGVDEIEVEGVCLPKKQEIRQWQDIKLLDAQIRTIDKPDEDNDKYIIDIGVFESLGEQGGDIFTEFFEQMPDYGEVVERIRDELLELKTELEMNNVLSDREEKQLEILNKIPVTKIKND